MPSYIGHTACAIKLMDQLKLNDDQKKKFIIGNMIPDIKQVDIDYSLNEFDNKRNIQRAKRKTHFRRKTNKILEFPNCDVFLEKYEKEIKKHIETLAYFFHLCTDYYYFRFFLPKVITFLDKNYAKVTEKDNFYYVKINKIGTIINNNPNVQAAVENTKVVETNTVTTNSGTITKSVTTNTTTISAVNVQNEDNKN